MGAGLNGDAKRFLRVNRVAELTGGSGIQGKKHFLRRCPGKDAQIFDAGRRQGFQGHFPKNPEPVGLGIRRGHMSARSGISGVFHGNLQPVVAG